ncbi:MAG: hypothetical protein ACRD6W_09020, partial [Nitrososphaerales archaeon]
MATNTASAKGQAAPPAPLPFRVGAQPESNLDFTPPAVTLGTSTQPLSVYHPSAESFLRGVWIQVVGTAASNAADVAFKPDAPFSAINTLSFTDVQQRFIVGPFGGYDLMVINKFGGYFNTNDPRADVNYSAASGSSATDGSFAFTLYLPLEWDLRTGMGSLVNKSTASTFSLNVTIETEGNIYSTSPTDAPSVQVTFHQEAYLQPANADAQGNPLSQSPQAVGSTQYWARSVVGGAGALSSGGFQNIQLQGGLGFPIRNILLECYDVADGTRANGDTAWPTPLLLTYKGVQLMNQAKAIWKMKMGRQFGYSDTTADTANGLENGVYVLPFNTDNTAQPGSASLGNALLQTNT